MCLQPKSFRIAETSGPVRAMSFIWINKRLAAPARNTITISMKSELVKAIKNRLHFWRKGGVPRTGIVSSPLLIEQLERLRHHREREGEDGCRKKRPGSSPAWF
jgi:hypothetical protein